MPANFLPTSSEYLRVLPEIILTLVGTLIMFFEGVLQEKRKGIYAPLAVLGLIAALIGSIAAYGDPGPAFQNMLLVDGFATFFRVLVIGVGLLAVFSSTDYLRVENAQGGEFYALILFSTAGMCLMAGATELILIFLAVELTSIPLYILAGYFRNEPRSAEAGMKYFLFGAMSSGILLYGMSLAYGFAAASLGGASNANDLTQFARIGELAGQAGEGQGQMLTLALILIVAGLGYKLAVVPFHGWSPDVYQGAPTPITAFISTASKTAGFLLLFRLLTAAFPGLAGSASPGAELGGWTSMLALLALVTLIVGNLAALPQTNAKRLLAYSSIAQAGFVLLGLVAWAAPQAYDRDQGTAALLYYLVVYTLTNIGAFGALTAVLMATGGDEISDLNGLARRNLPLAALMAVCVLSLAGVPPLAGFFAKFYVFMVGWQAGAQWLVIVALITTVVSLYYYLKLLKAMFMEPPPMEDGRPAPFAAPRWITATVAVAAVALVGLGLFPNAILGVISRVQAVAGL